MTALAELGWTHQDSYPFYLQRLDEQYPRLDLLHIHYRLPDLPELSERRVFTDTTAFFVDAPPKLTIHYAFDGFPTMPPRPHTPADDRSHHNVEAGGLYGCRPAAPTLLNLMGLAKPREMAGHSLIEGAKTSAERVG